MIHLVRKGDGWYSTRYLIRGTRIRPKIVWRAWQDGWSRERCCAEWDLTMEQVDAAIEFCERRSKASRKVRA